MNYQRHVATLNGLRYLYIHPITYLKVNDFSLTFTLTSMSSVSAPVHLELWTGFGCVGLGPRGFGDRASLDNDLLDCPKIESFEEK